MQELTKEQFAIANTNMDLFVELVGIKLNDAPDIYTCETHAINSVIKQFKLDSLKKRRSPILRKEK